MRIGITSLLLVGTLLLSGCSMQRTLPAVDVYGLSLPEAVATEKTATGPVLRLAWPVTSIAFQGNDLIYRDRQLGMNPYLNSRWQDSPARMITFYLQRSLENSGVFTAVVTPTSVSTSDWLLESTLHDFSHHIQDDTRSSASISIQFTLVKMPQNQVTATRTFSVELPLAEQNAETAVAGLNQAMQQIASELVIWLQQAVEFPH